MCSRDESVSVACSRMEWDLATFRVNSRHAATLVATFPNETAERWNARRPLTTINPNEVAMAAEHSETPPTPYNAGAPPWPTYRSGGHRYPVSLCLVPGIQAPDLVDAEGMIHCGITDIREPLGPGVGTLFVGSFDNQDEAVPVCASSMRMGQQAIRQVVLEHLIQESTQVQQMLLRALDALQAEDLDRYVEVCLEVEVRASLLSVRTEWLAGIIAIIGGPEDPLVRRGSRSGR